MCKESIAAQTSQIFSDRRIKELYGIIRREKIDYEWRKEANWKKN